MRNIFTFFIAGLILGIQIYSQELPALNLKSVSDSKQSFFTKSLKESNSILKSKSFLETKKQIKERKVVNTYYGAGYTFVIFTSGDMNQAYPVFDTRNGDFLSEFNLFFGFAIAKAVSLEIETSILFTHNDRTITYGDRPPYVYGGTTNNYITAYQLGMFSLMPAVNVRFFPFFMKTKSFARLFFIGGGAGFGWIKEDYNFYLGQVNLYNPFFFNATTSQWAPIFRAIAGFTGSGGQFGFGGEVRLNFVPLDHTYEPFVTRHAQNYNSVDLALRFYFSL